MQTNFYPINFEFESFQVQRLLYQDGLLNEFRSKYNSIYSFFRGGEYIYISPFQDGGMLGDLVTLDIQSNERIVGSLIKHIFFRTFKEAFNDIVPLDFYPFRFLSRQNKHDLLYAILPEELKGKIGYRRQTEVQFRRVDIKGRPTWGAVINLFHKWIFNINCKTLHLEGFDLRNVSVVHSVPVIGLEQLIAPDESLVGTIVSVDNGIAIVDTNEGMQKFGLDELFVSKSKFNVESYLKFKLGATRTDKVMAAAFASDNDRFNAKFLNGHIDSIAKMLATLEYRNADGFAFKIMNDAEIEVNKFDLIKPTYIFSYDGYKKEDYPDRGLNTFGPYDSSSFSIKRPKVLVVCHRANRGGFTSFLGKLKDGLPNSLYFKSGLIDKYRLNGIDFSIHELGNYSVEEYLDVSRKAIRQNSGADFDLAIIETKQDFRKQKIESNPYFHVKAYLMSLGIPVQLITNENVRKSDNYVDALLNSISLQMYAKMGGTPWVLPASTNVDREIIIGIGSALQRSNSFSGASQLKVVGITTFFSSDGNYLFGNKCREVSYSDYFDELLTNLRHSITDYSKRDGWAEGNIVRIIVHVFKPIKNIEAEVVDVLIKSFPQYVIKYAFVTISETSPFIMFDKSEIGVKFGSQMKGIYVPKRGANMIIDERSCLLQLIGPREIKTIRHGVSRPVLIKIHEKSTFVDLNYVVQQIYNFTNLSWRSFFPAQLPVTLYYSDLIASILSKLKGIPGWNSDILNGYLKFKKWFL